MLFQLDAEAFRKVHPLEFYKKFLPEGIRPDGRSLNMIRESLISSGSLRNCEGSSLVKTGNTSVVCGIKAEVMIPTEEAPRDGRVVISFDFPSICASDVTGNWEEVNERKCTIQQRLASVLYNCEVLDLSQLCIEEGKASWVLYADLYCLENDGNVFDAALIALLTALRNVSLPKVEISKDEEAIVTDEKANLKLKLNHYPIPLSFGLLSDYILVDPTSEEESLLSWKLTAVYNERKELCMLFKPGGIPISQSSLKYCMELAKKRTDRIITMINNSLSN
ncbi:hypothetical protein FDP41_006422 [Naegleria fowleri]|uniref:Ribosomal RNA-processing protein 43 n=1 Tax=Naegleria fowleri TaxID=5763 RepID=A0A6A5BK23_NAEFO|nr:uncharacterized protein FDP41_006422 [Naegleria fowleri]KAF0974390.1 hypothetical protein FDP41_006422 [Naegleria fowleri]CAG4719390.1 unnamed protein product [Naegleria fowleri]